MDPGPGALVRCFSLKPKLDPSCLDGILLSHKHLDHSGDINVMIEAMTEGGRRRRGVLFAPADALDDDPVVLRYVRSYLERIEVLEENRTYSLKKLNFSTARKNHHSVQAYGFNFHLPGGVLSYITDTKYHMGLLAQYPGKILILNVVLLAEVPGRSIDHLSIEDVRLILKETKASVVVLTHFGTRVLEADPGKLATRLSDESGIRVIAARDGMILNLDEWLREK